MAKVSQQDLDRIAEWNTKRLVMQDEIHKAYDQYENCISQHSVLHPVYCRSQKVKVERLKFDHQNVTHNVDVWIQTNGIKVTPISKPF